MAFTAPDLDVLELNAEVGEEEAVVGDVGQRRLEQGAVVAARVDPVEPALVQRHAQRVVQVRPGQQHSPVAAVVVDHLVSNKKNRCQFNDSVSQNSVKLGKKTSGIHPKPVITQ